jgi:Fusaric acid resistance protein-like
VSRLPRTTRADLLPALRVAVSVVGPLVLLRLTGHIEASLYAAFGAFAAIYARRGPHLDRLLMQGGAGLLLIGCVTAGTAVSSRDAGPWPTVLGTATAAAVASVVSDRLRWLPPGPLFAVFGFGACASAPAQPGDVPVALLVSTGAAGFAVLVGAGGAALWLRRREPRPRPAQPDWRALIERATAYFAAALVSGGAAAVLGLHHGYWAAVAAVVPMAASGTEGRLVRAWHRLWGTAAGLVLAAVLLASDPGGWAVVALVAVLQVGAELFVLHHYATALVFVTPMALLMSRLASSGPVLPLLADRAVTTVIGVAVGVLAVLIVHDRRVDAPD